MAENGSKKPDLRDKLMAEHDKAKNARDYSRLSDIKKQMQSMPGLKFPAEYLQNSSDSPSTEGEESTEETAEFGQPSNITSDSENKESPTEDYQKMVGADQTNAPKAVDKNPTPGQQASEEPKAPSIFGRAKNAVSNITGRGKNQEENAQAGNGKNVADKAEDKKEDLKTAQNVVKHGAQALSGNLVAAGQLIADLWKNKKSRKLIYLLFAIPLILIIIETAVFASFMGLFSGNVSALTGGTMTRPADPLTDREWLEKVLGLSGDQIIGSKQSAALLTGLSSDIGSFKSQTTDPAIIAKLDVIAADISKVQSSKASTDADQLVKDLKDLMSNYDNGMIPAFTGPTSAPLGNISPTGFNTTIHGGSFLEKTPDEGHGVYIQNNAGSCDATDIDAPAGTAVLSIFGGTVVKSESDGHKASLVMIKSSNGNFIAAYAHLDNVVAKDTVVTAGQQIGIISDKYNSPQVHTEISYKGTCLVTSFADQIDWNNSGQKDDVGQYLYNTIKSKFNF